jgi:hypothetical protein
MKPDSLPWFLKQSGTLCAAGYSTVGNELDLLTLHLKERGCTKREKIQEKSEPQYDHELKQIR